MVIAVKLLLKPSLKWLNVVLAALVVGQIISLLLAQCPPAEDDPCHHLCQKWEVYDNGKWCYQLSTDPAWECCEYQVTWYVCRDATLDPCPYPPNYYWDFHAGPVLWLCSKCVRIQNTPLQKHCVRVPECDVQE